MTLAQHLSDRSRLPAEFRFLVAEFPRDRWTATVGPFTTFYLERHELFRRIAETMTADAEAFLNGGDPDVFAQRITRLGGLFLDELHSHHQVEDHYYFPRIAQLDKRVSGAFDMLETDHHHLDGALGDFQIATRSAIAASRREDRFVAADRLLSQIRRMDKMLTCHLSDEEDIVVPLMLKYGEAAVEG